MTMKLDRTARTILGVTALAWAIPFAQAATTSREAQVGVILPQANSAKRDNTDAGIAAPAAALGAEGICDGIARRD
jgi:hypothetical protein